MNVWNGINRCSKKKEWDKSNIIEKKLHSFIPQNTIIPLFFIRLILIHLIPYITKKDYQLQPRSLYIA